MSGHLGMFCHLFSPINLAGVSLVLWTMLTCLPSTGDHALCRGGQRQRIPSEWKKNSRQEDSVGNRWRLSTWPLFTNTLPTRNFIMNWCGSFYKGLGIWLDVIYVLQLKIQTIVSSPSWGISWSGKLLLNPLRDWNVSLLLLLLVDLHTMAKLMKGWYQCLNQMSPVNMFMYDNDTLTISSMKGIYFLNADSSRSFPAHAVPTTANNYGCWY